MHTYMYMYVLCCDVFVCRCITLQGSIALLSSHLPSLPPSLQDPEELQSVEEDLDSLLANVEYIQSNIVELQNDLIAVDDSKVSGHAAASLTPHKCLLFFLVGPSSLPQFHLPTCSNTLPPPCMFCLFSTTQYT